MNFDEWWDDQCSGAPTMVFDTEKEMAQAAWDAAKRIEREECAKLCEKEKADWFSDRANAVLDCAAEAIRARK